MAPRTAAHAGQKPEPPKKTKKKKTQGCGAKHFDWRYVGVRYLCALVGVDKV